ncbi:hypothetical protein BX616_003868, partial [Lobosporangium transversale]
MLVIPELLSHLGQFLDVSDLAVACLVNKTWNAIFTPHLYRVIELQGYEKCLDLEREMGLQLVTRIHSNLVRYLVLRCEPTVGNMPFLLSEEGQEQILEAEKIEIGESKHGGKDKGTGRGKDRRKGRGKGRGKGTIKAKDKLLPRPQLHFRFQKLEELVLFFTHSVNTPAETWPRVMNLLCQNPNLTKLYISMNLSTCYVPTEFLQTLSQACPRLQILHLDGDLDDEALSIIADQCTRLTDLNMIFNLKESPVPFHLPSASA